MLVQAKARKADTVSASPHGSPRWCLVVVAFILVGREQPRALARTGHIEQDQPPVLRFCRRNNGRGTLHGRLGNHVGCVGEPGVRGAARAILTGVGGTDAKTDRGSSGDNCDLHGLAPHPLVKSGSACLSQPPVPGIGREGDEWYVGSLSQRSTSGAVISLRFSKFSEGSSQFLDYHMTHATGIVPRDLLVARPVTR
jgi:hypothetical protein